MIFVNERKSAYEIQAKLKTVGIEARFLIGGLEQAERDKLIDEFRSEVYPVLISTNVLARGIDVPQVDVVINFDVPSVTICKWTEPDYANYMHRIGRTGRFGTDGLAVTFISTEVEHEPELVNKIAKYYAIEIEELKDFTSFE